MASGDVFREERNGKPKQLQNLHTYRPEFFINGLGEVLTTQKAPYTS
jgi:hypothetical protein